MTFSVAHSTGHDVLLIRTVSLLAFAILWLLFFDMCDAEATPHGLGVPVATAALFSYSLYRYLKHGDPTGTSNQSAESQPTAVSASSHQSPSHPDHSA
jgi:hypothetical protein